MYISTDSEETYFDINGSRLQIRDIIVLANEEVKNALLEPISKFYLTLSEGNLYYYSNGWIQLNEAYDDTVQTEIIDKLDLLSSYLNQESSPGNLPYNFEDYALLSAQNIFTADQTVNGDLTVSGDLLIEFNNNLTSLTSLIIENNNNEVPTKTSDLINDVGFITGYTELDPIFKSVSGNFATKAEIADLISAELDPKFAEVSGTFATKNELFSKSYNDLTDKPLIPTKVSELTNDSQYLTSYIETDPVFSAQSGQFALKSEITNLISEELDPKFAEVSGTFATKSSQNTFNADQIINGNLTISGDLLIEFDDSLTSVSSLINNEIEIRDMADSYISGIIDASNKGQEIINQILTSITPINNKIYKHTLAANDSISIDISQLSSSFAVTFELHLIQPSTAVSFTFTNIIKWIDDINFNSLNSAPDFSNGNKLYAIVFRWDGTDLLANVAYTKDIES